MPASLAQRQRRRRFLERAPLERLRKYEDLLPQKKVVFEPLHEVMAREKESSNAESGDDSEHEHHITSYQTISFAKSLVSHF